MPSAPPILYPAPGSRFRKPGLRTLLVVLAIPILWVVWRFEPSGQFFYPRCIFYEVTGWQCPGCGGTRAVHALLHGRWGEAWHFNPLAILLIPPVAWLIAREAVGRMTARWWRFPSVPGWCWIVSAIAVAGFGMARNLA